MQHNLEHEFAVLQAETRSCCLSPCLKTGPFVSNNASEQWRQTVVCQNMEEEGNSESSCDTQGCTRGDVWEEIKWNQGNDFLYILNMPFYLILFCINKRVLFFFSAPQWGFFSPCILCFSHTIMLFWLSEHNNISSRHLLFYKLKHSCVVCVTYSKKHTPLFLTTHLNNGEKLYLLNAEWLPSARLWQHSVLIIIFYYVFESQRLKFHLPFLWALCWVLLCSGLRGFPLV